MSTYPIIYQNRAIGALETAREGLFTVFSAACEAVAPKLRLAVYGAEHSAYLGLMLPETDGRLHLRKRLSRMECERLPQPILFAADEHEPIPEAEPPARQAKPTPQGWSPAPDGTLRCSDAGQTLIAVPRERIAAPGVDAQLLRRIEGREYLVFSL